MKEREYGLDCWEGYTRFLKKSLDRNLTKEEIKLAMSKYILGVKADKTLEELK